MAQVLILAGRKRPKRDAQRIVQTRDAYGTEHERKGRFIANNGKGKAELAAPAEIFLSSSLN